MASVTSGQIHEHKASLRKTIRAALKKVEQDDILTQSEQATRKVLALPQYEKALAISVFLSMPNKEILTRDLVCQAVNDGKRVFVPYIHQAGEKDTKVMDMLELRSQGDLDSLERDAWGIPTLTTESIPSRQNALGGRGVREDKEVGDELKPCLDLIILPGLAFDRTGGRLGQGKGFYDGYLSRYKAAMDGVGHEVRMAHLVGLGLRQQVLPEGKRVPTTEEDWRLDEIVFPEE